jgi:hypothetical protein
MDKEKTVININLIIWCFVVLGELFILAWILQSGIVLLFALLLYSPITAAFNWPDPDKKVIEENKTTELKTEKAE